MEETDPERLDQLLRITDNISFIMYQFPPPFSDMCTYALAVRACILYQQKKFKECYQTLQIILDQLSRLVLHAVRTLINVFNVLLKLSDLLQNEEFTRKV